jgi:uncharacterized membrane protein
MENPNNRLEVFSDGVFAIALTILIIEIKVPPIDSVRSNRELWIAFARLWPSWVAFFVSFITILISWVGHDHCFKLLAKTSNRLIYANALLLLSIATMPFFTAVLSEYLGTGLAGPAITMYSAFSVLLSTGWVAFEYAALNPESLLRPGVHISRMKDAFKYTKLGLVINILNTVLSLWLPTVAFAIIVLLYVGWLILGISLREERMITEPQL